MVVFIYRETLSAQSVHMVKMPRQIINLSVTIPPIYFSNFLTCKQFAFIVFHHVPCSFVFFIIFSTFHLKGQIGELKLEIADSVTVGRKTILWLTENKNNFSKASIRP